MPRTPHLLGKVESLTEVDRDGHPDDPAVAAEAARMLRYANRYTIHGNRDLGCFPEPDAYGKASRGRRAPLWKRSTVWAAGTGAQGMGGGHKPGTPGVPAEPHPYAGYERLWLGRRGRWRRCGARRLIGSAARAPTRSACLVRRR
jgi:hypothetical protein